MILRFKMKVMTWRQVVSKVKAKLCNSDPRKIRAGVDDNAKWEDHVQPTAKYVLYPTGSIWMELD